MASPPIRACRSCSTPLPADAQFCPRCGSRTPTEISGGTTIVEPPTPDALAEQRERLQQALGADYAVEHLLGSGGFAQVWAAHDKRLDRRVAVKVLHPELVASRALIERFKREAQAVAKLRHPGIVPIYGVGEHEGLAWYLMPLVEGMSLREALRDGPLPAAEARRILRETAAALAVAHKAGIVHRDIKPENVMLDGEERRVLVMDFGIAKSVQAGATGLTGTGMIIGTPAYMSPEQATASKEIGPPSDIYSLGVVGFEMITGSTPFHADSVPELVLKQVAAPAPSLGAVNVDAPDDLVIAVNRCLTKEPAERWRDAGELLLFLEQHATPAATGTPVPKQLRRYGKRSWRPTRRLVRVGVPSLAAALLIVTVMARPDLVYLARDFWGLVPEPPAATTPPPNMGVEVQRHWSGAVFSLGSSAIGVWDRTNDLEGLHVFDGERWVNHVLPEHPQTATQADGAVLLFSETSLYRWTAAGVRREADLPFPVRKAWARGSDVLVVGEGGVMAWRTATGWRRQPSPRRSAIWTVFGPDVDHLVALGSIPGDSVLEYGGVAWEGVDPRPDTAARWQYLTGAALPDGTMLIGGRSGDGPLLLSRRGEQRWRPVPIASDTLRFAVDGLWAERADSVVMWRTNCSADCVRMVTPSGFAPVSAFSSMGLWGIASLRGVPYALRADGTIWNRRRGQWAHVAEVPSLVTRHRASAETDSGVFSAAVGDGRLAGFFVSGRRVAVPSIPVRRFRGVAVSRGLLWLLGADGAAYQLTCRPNQPCQMRTITFPAPMSAFAQRQSDFIAVGARGLIMRIDRDEIHPIQLPLGTAPESLVSVSTRDDGSFVVLGAPQLLSYDSAGHGRVLGLVPADLYGASFVAALPAGGAAIATVTGRVALMDSVGHLVRVIRSDRSETFRVTSIAAVDSLRVALSVAEDSDDPYGGGGVMLVTATRDYRVGLSFGDAPIARARTSFYEVEVYGDTAWTRYGVRGPFLAARGIAGLFATWPVELLPR